MDIEHLLILIGISILIGLSKGGLGPVVVSTVTPLLSLVMPVPQAVATALPLLLIGDVFALRAYWGQWELHHVRLMLPAAVLGVLAGTFLLTSLPDDVLRPVLGLFTLLAVGYKLLSKRFAAAHYHARPWHGYLAGAASGLGSALANLGAPPYTAYMLLQDVSPRLFIGTTTLFFAIVNLLKLPGLIAAGLIDLSALRDVILMLPLVLLGVHMGRRFIEWIDPAVFEWGMIALLVAASTLLLLS
ncbi:MAG: sulfite exporter TauE/SafE family protein [Chloroflexi bacterium]|nr:sulfite exporter TauE/SafE family protein [Chloroflexota bacterium]